jgi:hypothetical protein
MVGWETSGIMLNVVALSSSVDEIYVDCPILHLLCSYLLSKNIKIRIYKTVILPVVLYGCETFSDIKGGK